MERLEFEQLALQHLDALHRMAMQLTRRPEDASDLVQETYLRALQAAKSFEEKGGGIRPWLFTILHNAHRTRLDRQRRAPRAVDGFTEADPASRAPDDPPPAWNMRSLDWEHVDGALKRAIDDLRPEQREILLLWGVEGLKYRQIAEIMDLPIGTVMSRLHRVRRVLTDAIAASEEPEVRVPEPHDDGRES